MLLITLLILTVSNTLIFAIRTVLIVNHALLGHLILILGIRGVLINLVTLQLLYFFEPPGTFLPDTVCPISALAACGCRCLLLTALLVVLPFALPDYIFPILILLIALNHYLFLFDVSRLVIPLRVISLVETCCVLVLFVHFLFVVRDTP